MKTQNLLHGGAGVKHGNRVIARHVWVWHYGVNCWHYFAPNPNLESLVRDIGYYVAHGVDGLMVQGAWLRFQRVIEAEGITTTTEGGPNIKDSIAAMDGRSGR